MVTTIRLRPETKSRLDDIKTHPPGEWWRGTEPPSGHGTWPWTVKRRDHKKDRGGDSRHTSGSGSPLRGGCPGTRP